MAIAINGAGTITGLSAGGLPDASIITADIANSAVTDGKIAGMASSKLTGTLPAISGTNLTNLDATDLVGAVPTAALSNIEGKGADIASSSTIVIGTDGGYFDITGTTGITAMTVAVGRMFTLQFDGVVILTNSSTLKLSGAANFTTAAGDHLTFISVAANDVRQVGFGLTSGGSPIASTPQFKHIHGSYNMATTGSLAVTGVGFAPLAVLGMANSGDYTNASWGWAAKTDAGFDDICLLDQHDYSADMMGWVATAVLTLWHTGSKYSYMVPTSFDADGVTFNRAKYSTPTLNFNYFLLFFG